jgi:hypothetical protein
LAKNIKEKGIKVDFVIWGKNKFVEKINVFDLTPILQTSVDPNIQSSDLNVVSAETKTSVKRFIIFEDAHEICQSIYYQCK